jgi:hypothetical protein
MLILLGFVAGCNFLCRLVHSGAACRDAERRDALPHVTALAHGGHHLRAAAAVRPAAAGTAGRGRQLEGRRRWSSGEAILRRHSGKAVKLNEGEAALDLFFKSLALACVL